MNERRKTIVFASLTAIIVALCAELVAGYWLFWRHEKSYGALYEMGLLAVKQSGRDTQPRGQPSSLQPPAGAVSFSSTPLPFYRPDPALGYRPDGGRFTVTIASDAVRHVFVATISPDGDRATRHDTAPQRPKETIWIFGDSWVFGWANPDETTFPFIVQARMPQNRVRNFAFNGYANVHALIQMRELKSRGDSPDVVVMAYASYYDRRNTAAPSRLREFAYLSNMNRFLTDVSLYLHPRAKLLKGKIAIDTVPLFCSDNEWCDQPDPPEREQQDVTLAILAEARENFPKARYVLAYTSGPDDLRVVQNAPALGYAVVDLRARGPMESDTYAPLDNHPGPKAQTAFADKLFGALNK